MFVSMLYCSLFNKYNCIIILCHDAVMWHTICSQDLLVAYDDEDADKFSEIVRHYFSGTSDTHNNA